MQASLRSSVLVLLPPCLYLCSCCPYPPGSLCSESSAAILVPCQATASFLHDSVCSSRTTGLIMSLRFSDNPSSRTAGLIVSLRFSNNPSSRTTGLIVSLGFSDNPSSSATPRRQEVVPSEICPQSRHLEAALDFFMFLTFPISWPQRVCFCHCLHCLVQSTAPPFLPLG